MIKIQTSGDYVQLIYVDPVQESVQQELKSDTDAFECSYDSDGKLFMQFGAMRFENPDPTDFEINGVAVTDAADFISKLNALFTSGGGGGATIYTGDGSLSGDRGIDLNGHQLTISANSREYLELDGTAFYADLRSDDGIAATRLTLSSDLVGNNVSFTLQADDGTNFVGVQGNAQIKTITYNADIHTFNGVINLPTQAAPSAPNDGDMWREDNTNTGLKIRINGVTKTITVS